MMPAQAATQKMRREAMLRSYSGARARRCRSVERNQRDERDRRQSQRQRALVRNGREIDGQDERPDERHRQDAAEVVHRLGRLVDVTRHEDERHHERHADQRQRDQEDRSPPEVLEQGAGDQRPESSDPAADCRPERDRLRSPRPRPQRRDQGERRRVGHACREPSEHPCAEEDFVRRRPRGQQAGRDRQRHPQEEHQLAPVAVSERAEVENRRGETERVADRDQVEHGLRRVERLGDVGQRDVGDRQVEVGDRSHQDQRDENEPGARRSCRGRPTGCAFASRALCHVGHSFGEASELTVVRTVACRPTASIIRFG